jgi:fructose-1,6-bisphosphatase/inositol monophosphatase family enzyme
VSTVSALAAATVLTTDETFRERPEWRPGWERVASASALSRSWGDCFGYLLLATGRAEGMFDPVMSPWDAAALQPIVQEAGGVFTDWLGRETAFGGSVVATNRQLAASMRSLLAEPRGV